MREIIRICETTTLLENRDFEEFINALSVPGKWIGMWVMPDGYASISGYTHDNVAVGKFPDAETEKPTDDEWEYMEKFDWSGRAIRGGWIRVGRASTNSGELYIELCKGKARASIAKLLPILDNLPPTIKTVSIDVWDEASLSRAILAHDNRDQTDAKAHSVACGPEEAAKTVKRLAR